MLYCNFHVSLGDKTEKRCDLFFAWKSRVRIPHWYSLSPFLSFFVMLFLLLLRDNGHCWLKSWSVITSSVIGHSHTWDYKNLSLVCGADRKKSTRGPLFGITSLVMPNSDPEGRIFRSAPKTKHDRFFFLHTFRSPAFGFNVGAMNESRWRPPYWQLTSYVTSTSNVLTTELRDLLYNQCIDNACWFSFLIYPTGRIRVCKIKFVSTGESRGKPCPICKKKKISLFMAVAIRDFSVSTCLSHPRINLLSQIVHHCYMSRLMTKPTKWHGRPVWSESSLSAEESLGP